MFSVVTNDHKAESGLTYLVVVTNDHKAESGLTYLVVVTNDHKAESGLTCLVVVTNDHKAESGLTCRSGLTCLVVVTYIYVNPTLSKVIYKNQIISVAEILMRCDQHGCSLGLSYRQICTLIVHNSPRSKCDIYKIGYCFNRILQIFQVCVYIVIQYLLSPMNDLCFVVLSH